MQRLHLFGRTVVGIGRWRVAVSALITYAQRARVVATHMATTYVHGAAVVDGAIPRNVEVVARPLAEATALVVTRQHR